MPGRVNPLAVPMNAFYFDYLLSSSMREVPIFIRLRQKYLDVEKLVISKRAESSLHIHILSNSIQSKTCWPMLMDELLHP